MKRILLIPIILIFTLFLFTACNFDFNGMIDNSGDSQEDNEGDTNAKSNEIILLVDASYSLGSAKAQVDKLVESIINSCTEARLGIVTFGYDQIYAVELSSDTSDMYSRYLKAPLPDTTATDIESAINYAVSLCTSSSGSKIVLISDGAETDGNAINAARSAASKGITVDTVCIAGKMANNEVQIVSLQVPDDIVIAQPFTVKATIQSSFSGKATVTPFDNYTAGTKHNIELEIGLQTVDIPFTLPLPGLHHLSVEIESENDTFALNNIYTSYVNIRSFDKILVIESIENESESLLAMLSKDLNVSVVNVSDHVMMPKTVNEIRAYDQVILCNVSNSDMPYGFDEILYSYVYDFGGGLFTICGNEFDSDPNDGDWTANAYTREDMFGTTYQKLLPVEAITYTPPVGVMIIIDTSGSMLTMDGGSGEGSKLYAAKQGAEAYLDELTEHDYVGIMALGDTFTEDIRLIPCTEREKILASIDKIDSDGGGTIFSASLERAGKALSALAEVDKRHIIVVTDGEPAGGDAEAYQYRMQENAKNGITMSIVGIQCTSSAQSLMKNILVEYAGVQESNFHNVDDISAVPQAMREDLEVSEIKEVNYETFVPKINGFSPIVNGLTQEDIPSLDGFYGLKLKSEASAILMGEFTPIYSQWQFGKGRVGTFACDLNGTFSSDFISSEGGKVLINNIVRYLLPTHSIRPDSFDVAINGDNYRQEATVITDLEDGQYIELTVTALYAENGKSDIQSFISDAENGQIVFSFNITEFAIHEIKVQKKDASGLLLDESVYYKVLSYSKEYNSFFDRNDASENAANIAEHGNGKVIESPDDVFIFRTPATDDGNGQTDPPGKRQS